MWRAGPAAGYVAGGSAGEWGVVGILAACEGANSADEVLGRMLVALSGETTQPWPAFALVTAAPGGGVTVLVNGQVEVVVERLDGTPVRVRPQGSWSAKVVSGVSQVRLGSASGTARGLADLRSGVLPASGALITLPGDKTAEDEPRPAPGDLTRAGAPWAATSVAPAVAGEADAGEAGGEEVFAGEAVSGRYCPEGHFNAPRDRWCRVCGQPIAKDAREVQGERPPLVTLVWDSGESDVVTRDTVVGRDPAADKSVSDGTAESLVPKGKSEGMSRIHAELRLVGWDILLSDRGSTNGTFVWDDDRQAWHRLGRDERYPLTVGSIVAFGERTATVEAPATG